MSVYSSGDAGGLFLLSLLFVMDNGRRSRKGSLATRAHVRHWLIATNIRGARVSFQLFSFYS